MVCSVAEHVEANDKPPKAVVSSILYEVDVKVQFTLVVAAKAFKVNEPVPETAYGAELVFMFVYPGGIAG